VYLSTHLTALLHTGVCCVRTAQSASKTPPPPLLGVGSSDPIKTYVDAAPMLGGDPSSSAPFGGGSHGGGLRHLYARVTGQKPRGQKREGKMHDDGRAAAMAGPDDVQSLTTAAATAPGRAKRVNPMFQDAPGTRSNPMFGPRGGAAAGASSAGSVAVTVGGSSCW
jgi:hypothetical protein